MSGNPLLVAVVNGMAMQHYVIDQAQRVWTGLDLNDEYINFYHHTSAYPNCTRWVQMEKMIAQGALQYITEGIIYEAVQRNYWRFVCPLANHGHVNLHVVIPKFRR